MSLQDEMVRYRAKYNLSQSAFAHKCGVSLQTINSVENGNQSPSKLTESKIRLAMEENKNDEV